MFDCVKNFFIKKEKKINFKNLSLKDINNLINDQKTKISWNISQLMVFKEREMGGSLFGGEMSERNGTKDLRLVKPESFTKRKLKYTFGNSLTIIEMENKQFNHNIKLLERLKKMKYKV